MPSKESILEHKNTKTKKAPKKKKPQLTTLYSSDNEEEEPKPSKKTKLFVNQHSSSQTHTVMPSHKGK